MPTGLADLLHDAAVLHRFLDFIEEYCKEQERSQTYVDSSGLFFEYVEKLAIGIKQELRHRVERATRFPKRLSIIRRELLTFKYYLRLLHTLIKPAADAHTLTIPEPLVALASDQLQLVDGMANSHVLILLTSEFMYFQRPHTDIKDQARNVGSIIPEASFPPKLGFIELPYSQGPSFFTNLAIYHEIGHFVYEELSNRTPPYSAITTLRLVTARSLNRALGKNRRDRQAFAFGAKILENWTQEIFCDLFAIRLLGPAFSFALIEMLGMLGFLSRADWLRFNTTHPAPACRFAEHLKQRRADSWLQAIADVQAEQKRLLERLAALPSSSYTFYFDDKTPARRSLVDAFVDVVVPSIRKLVCQVTEGAIPSVNHFNQIRPQVQESFRAGVVPSTNKSDACDPVSIINSAFCFYLTSLPEVIKDFEKPTDQNNVATHSLWTKRLEMWTMKAIEDAQIMTRHKKVQRYGPF